MAEEVQQKVQVQEKNLWNEGDDHIDIPKEEGEGEEENRGVIYVGRIPYGFFEEQMLEYFSQFGEITRLRLSRNKKTGKSKHYAFIEFKEEEVADIVADTMDGYLMFNHILSCKRVSPEKVHPAMWKGSYTSAKKGLHTKPQLRKTIEKRRIAKAEEALPAEKIRQIRISLLERELSKRKKLEKLGISYDFPGFAATATEQEKKQAAAAVQEEAESD